MQRRSTGADTFTAISQTTAGAFATADRVGVLLHIALGLPIAVIGITVVAVTGIAVVAAAGIAVVAAAGIAVVAATGIAVVAATGIAVVAVVAVTDGFTA